MNCEVLCTLPLEEVRKFQDLSWMKSAIEDLAIVVAEQNHILLEDSRLYQRLINDNKEYSIKINEFWDIYLEKFKDVLGKDERLVINYKTLELFKITNNIDCCQLSHADLHKLKEEEL
ncbi:MAG: hypothetical protein FWE14_04200 [Lachnospiraceae bacterium]|nr:hypothetical protein [Lachnospiraceae bacterium]